MIKLKKTYLRAMIKLCNFGLKFQDGAGDQSDINSVIKMKNYFDGKLELLCEQ